MPKTIDFHCDTLGLAFSKQCEDLFQISGSMSDLSHIFAAHTAAQFFAIFFPEKERLAPCSDTEYYNTCLHIMQQTLTRYSSQMTLIRCFADFAKSLATGKLSAFLTLEDGRLIDGQMDMLSKVYQDGIRLISLTWNSANCFGFPNSPDRDVMSRGLTAFGIDAIRQMNDLGMIIDVSHLSDGGFYDVARHSSRPFAASHSNCRALTPHPRNLTDDMIHLLAEKGGIAGLNFCPSFLQSGSIEDTDSKVSDMCRHLRHLVDKGGIECAAIGSDFDGICGTLEIPHPEMMPLLYDALPDYGFTSDDIDKIAWKNAARFLRDVL